MTTRLNDDLSNMLASVDVCIVILDREQRIRRFTPRAREVLNLVPTDIGRPIGEIDPTVVMPLLANWIDESVASLAVKEREVSDRQGRWYRLQIRPYRTSDGGVDGAVLSLIDVDMRARIDGLGGIGREQDLFLAMLSHELRTPLNSILLWAQLLRKNATIPEDARRAVVGIEQSAKAQSQIVDDLLDVSRIIAGKLEFTRTDIDFAALVRREVEAFRVEADAKGVGLEVTIDQGARHVAGEAKKLRQIVSNVLSNAVKFTPAGGRVAVRLETHEGRARVQVRDTGKGIAPEFLPRLFERFSQHDCATTRMHGGLGIGLGLARHMVTLHGGTIRGENNVGAPGATFTIELPTIVEALPEATPSIARP